jgi:hypothetical protein
MGIWECGNALPVPVTVWHTTYYIHTTYTYYILHKYYIYILHTTHYIPVPVTVWRAPVPVPGWRQDLSYVICHMGICHMSYGDMGLIG